jgi:hypothetical protein
LQKRPLTLRELLTLALICALGWLFFPGSLGLAQQLQTPALPTGLPSAVPSGPLPSTAPIAATAEEDRTNNIKNNGNNPAGTQGSNGVLSTGQILAIMQARPELIVDLKQVMADYLDQQGTQVQADSISDDMLYKGIASDAGLRGAISIWLRARGYITDSELDTNLDSKNSDDISGSLESARLDTNPLASGLPGNTALTESATPQNGASSSNGAQGKSDISDHTEGKGRSSTTKPDRNSPAAV